MSELQGVEAGNANSGRSGDEPTASLDLAAENARLRAETERLRRELAAARAVQGWRDEAQTGSARSAAPAESLADDTLTRLQLLESMLETVPAGVVLADARGRIVHGNAWVERMLKHPVLHSADTESYGEWVSFHADGRRVESHEYPLSRVIRDGEDHAQIDVHYRRGDGSLFWMRVIGEPVRDADGNRVGATVALVDIDEEIRLRAQQETLIEELDHRVRNAFTVARSVTSMSLRGHGVPSEARQAIEERLSAYAAAHARLVGRGWERASLGELCAETAGRIGGGRIALDGPEVEMPAREALALAMALYELATNASKHGALSEPDGHVSVSWRLGAAGEDGRRELTLTWVERGGPPFEETSRTGFGTMITGRALESATSGAVERTYAAEGLTWQLVMPLIHGRDRA
ncbi:MAG: HWE histidine kinase domain-containing protein [Shimia sp.]